MDCVKCCPLNITISHALRVTVVVCRRSGQYQPCQKSQKAWGRWFVVPTPCWVAIVDWQLLREWSSLFLEDVTTGRLPWPVDGPTLIHIWDNHGLGWLLNKQAKNEFQTGMSYWGNMRIWKYWEMESKYNHILLCSCMKLSKIKKTFKNWVCL